MLFSVSRRVICENCTGRTLPALTSWKYGKRRGKTITLRKHFVPSGLSANITLVPPQSRKFHVGASEKRQSLIWRVKEKRGFTQQKKEFMDLKDSNTKGSWQRIN